ncbi:DUF1152 domain-containing protein [Myxococcota bacterium]|nr:DUF1152 domain-containing protein [Myxococcota bacterium]
MDELSTLAPGFVRRLFGDDIRTVMICGCGGGFDFVHGMTLYPELVRRGKRVIVGSYSFGDPHRIGDPAPIVFEEGEAIAKRVTAASAPDSYYSPEVHVASFLDATYPSRAPHTIYAYYARAFSVPMLSRFYTSLVEAHAVDAVVLVDGGSDSLMRGDEEGLGDPIEDAVSVAAVASLTRPAVKLLFSVGLGADRFNEVSDAATLRAIAELTRAGGFLGATSLEPGLESLDFYRRCVEHIYARQHFRSVLTGAILSAAEGWFGADDVPHDLASRVRPSQLFLWPLMAMLWAFDLDVVARRSLIARWIRDCETPHECHATLAREREALGERRRSVENLPRHEDARFDASGRRR